MAELIFPRLVGSTGENHEIKGSAVRLGRADDNQIILADAACSRYHALISFSGKGYIVKNLSKNGTYLNGKRVEAELPLQSGDVLRLGGFQFTFEDPSPTRTELLSDKEATELSAGLRVDFGAMMVQRAIERRVITIPLEGHQWKLFNLLYQRKGKVCTRDEIIQAVYHPESSSSIPYDSAIEALVSRLRRKLFIDEPKKLPYIKAVRGKGYRLELET
jgi:pSer/pThr/pTyr-binding forkhead associated (FHA) protein